MVSSGSAPGFMKATMTLLQTQLTLYFVSTAYRFCTFKLLAKHGEEDRKVDWTRSLFEHLINLVLFHIQTSCSTRDPTWTCSTSRSRLSCCPNKKNMGWLVLYFSSCLFLKDHDRNMDVNVPRAAKVSLRSFLSMKPSLFWSIIVKAWGQRTIHEGFLHSNVM